MLLTKNSTLASLLKENKWMLVVVTTTTLIACKGKEPQLRWRPYYCDDNKRIEIEESSQPKFVLLNFEGETYKLFGILAGRGYIYSDGNSSDYRDATMIWSAVGGLGLLTVKGESLICHCS